MAVEDDARYRAGLVVLFRHSRGFALVNAARAPAAAPDALDAGSRDWPRTPITPSRVWASAAADRYPGEAEREV